jgi:hypothetical protein
VNPGCQCFRHNFLTTTTQLCGVICGSTKLSSEQIDNLRSDILNSNEDLGIILSEGLADPPKINFYSKDDWPWETARGPGQKERYLGAQKKQK